MTIRGWKVLFACLVAAILSAGTAMAYANRVARESERKWCGVVSTMDDAYRTSPPSTPAGRRIARDIAQLREDFGCPMP
jgi:hypothetical protein